MTTARVIAFVPLLTAWAALVFVLLRFWKVSTAPTPRKLLYCAPGIVMIALDILCLVAGWAAR